MIAHCATASTFDEIRDDDADFGLQETDSKATSAEGHSVFADHLNNLFAPLKFPPQLAKRILTHGSHPDAFQGHNAGLSFLGRRVLESYLLLMLSSSPRLEPSHDLELVVTRTLNTYALGEHVGSRWGLGRVMLWTPTVSAEDLQNADVHAAADIQKASSRRAAVLRSAGLYKVEGDAVTAVMGGIYYQHGASVAHRVFHTRLLPHILLGREATGLPWTFHRDALDACEHYGGLDGPLVSEESIKVPLLS
ncbi:hypothetical protein FISHEDRAFT_74432 [Fistulina hepatica ATCC 64428]|uniref:RNase III domain-containing protein n=1 Tax=Fistulina hepatica ATCC 64428 TaxID=1128425 RepID=A0A0D7A9X4_9AGAR|nr:hypothetical protein FISHEDRAFT_74432 [Fistulina hepatica ATCC 64428]